MAVVIYFWKDLRMLLRLRAPEPRRLVWLLALASVPVAALGLAFEDWFDEAFGRPRLVGVALIVTGLILVLSTRYRGGDRSFESSNVADAVLIGLAQALALIPGISRSGSTITAGLFRGFSDNDAVRFSFLLGVPAIAGATGKQLIDANFELGLEHLVGFIVAGISGYAAIALLVTALTRYGLGPFAVYCFVVGGLALVAF